VGDCGGGASEQRSNQNIFFLAHQSRGLVSIYILIVSEQRATSNIVSGRLHYDSYSYSWRAEMHTS
jgi:hypothetical protein